LIFLLLDVERAVAVSALSFVTLGFDLFFALSLEFRPNASIFFRGRPRGRGEVDGSSGED
jgi:hypothetical protein